MRRRCRKSCWTEWLSCSKRWSDKTEVCMLWSDYHPAKAHNPERLLIYCTSFCFHIWRSHSLALIKYSQLVPLNIHRAALLRLSALRQSASSECTRSPPRAWKHMHTHAASACAAWDARARGDGRRGGKKQLEKEGRSENMAHERKSSEGCIKKKNVRVHSSALVHV